MPIGITLVIILVIVKTSTAHSQAESQLKCYICSSYYHPECRDVVSGQEQYLYYCPNGTCSVMEVEDPRILGSTISVRSCGVPVPCESINYPVCCQCSTNGCNYNNICGAAHRHNINHVLQGVIIAAATICNCLPIHL